MSYEVQDAELIRNDIREYLKRHEEKDLLRFLTCGSVDDGKSTLIGKLLYDSHMIYEDQLAALHADSRTHGTTGGGLDPALLMDGLKAEREQGITIDVAYRYFSTSRRKFIIADCPGHEQYTRNMATGASTCDLAVILIDARKGVTIQTKRHSFICSLLRIKHVIVAINKMDLVDWSEETYERIKTDYNSFVARLSFSDIHFIPLSALKGDNVVEHSRNMPWYEGPTVLHHLESVNITTDRNLIDARFPVQYVLRPNLDFRGFCGTMASGVMRVGDEIMSLPSRHTSRISRIVTHGGDIESAFAPMAVTLILEDEIDVSRGNMLAPVNNVPHVGNQFEAMVVWMHETAAQNGSNYLIKHTTNMVPGTLSDIRYKMDVNTMRKDKGGNDIRMGLNEIGRCHFTLHRPIAFDSYDRNRATGSFIIIDRMTNITVGAGMIMDRIVPARHNEKPVSQNITKSESFVAQDERRRILNQKGATIWMTGLSGSGKSAIARQLEKTLTAMGHSAYILDGDNIRHGLNRDLGFSAEDRTENIRRISEVARLFTDAGVIVITSFISPYKQDRENARLTVTQGTGPDRFIETFVDTPLEVCEQRDSKGLYRKARAGEIPDFTGIDSPYEVPAAPEITLPTVELSIEESVQKIIEHMTSAGIIKDNP